MSFEIDASAVKKLHVRLTVAITITITYNYSFIIKGAQRLGEFQTQGSYPLMEPEISPF